ncbi:MAG TPA: hypothetical protein DIT93_12430 [Pelagibacterium sp.]|nr:hypothetical protein [Pelagibacterium sp.]
MAKMAEFWRESAARRSAFAQGQPLGGEMSVGQIEVKLGAARPWRFAAPLSHECRAGPTRSPPLA